MARARTTIVFDMDGLLVDTEPVARQAWAHLLAEAGYQLTDDIYRRMIGHRTLDSARLILAHYDLPETPASLAERKTALFADLRAQGIPPMPGLARLQAEIARRGVKWGVATSSPRQHAQIILGQLGLSEACTAVAGGDEVAQGKPAPDVYLLAARRLGAPPEHCLALEDSAPGGRAAVAAGMKTVVVPNEYTRLEDFGFAHAVYSSLHAIAADLDRLLAD